GLDRRVFEEATAVVAVLSLRRALHASERRTRGTPGRNRCADPLERVLRLRIRPFRTTTEGFGIATQDVLGGARSALRNVGAARGALGGLVRCSGRRRQPRTGKEKNVARVLPRGRVAKARIPLKAYERRVAELVDIRTVDARGRRVIGIGLRNPRRARGPHR